MGRFCGDYLPFFSFVLLSCFATAFAHGYREQHIEALLPYTQRVFQNVSKLEQKSTILEYTVASMEQSLQALSLDDDEDDEMDEEGEADKSESKDKNESKDEDTSKSKNEKSSKHQKSKLSEKAIKVKNQSERTPEKEGDIGDEEIDDSPSIGAEESETDDSYSADEQVYEKHDNAANEEEEREIEELIKSGSSDDEL